MYFPKWVYELLPYLYVIVGLLALLNLETSGVKGCGFLLATSGLLIFKMRRDYRRS